MVIVRSEISTKIHITYWLHDGVFPISTALKFTLRDMITKVSITEFLTLQNHIFYVNQNRNNPKIEGIKKNNFDAKLEKKASKVL